MFSEYCCCMSSLFRKRKLKNSGFPILEDAVDPECIIWENIGARKSYHGSMWTANALLAAVLLAASFYGMYFLACKEKDRIDLFKSNCQIQDRITKQQAYNDFKMENKAQQQGLMNCFCRQQKDLIGEEEALNI